MPAYCKLVRDEIPQIIESSGRKCVYEVLDDQRYAAELYRKMNEELLEFAAAEGMPQAVEELADLLEVVRALADLRGIRMEEAERVREKKAAKRGGFTQRIFLVEAENDF
ncbi:nucleoside triphosphate pyrophosphohydrolase [Paenibacillus doosanensis]|uniref:nucleoside triphosphate pyrophosphohydrolase n=1 Tax=Paenibacillus doosanensis TaxID=1229154 RepID=UPI00217F8DAF|nr:nucleoside triphosphate pyrophosphohydrolase [Paenibacillus doosanensis]MCS7460464.1 nucleoside triphosphate pyrophosphohydrolase [Paenibacillus doosanensis]